MLEFDVKESLHMNWTGKFIAPDEHWVHMTRVLTDFEFIVVTDGELYIADEHGRYVVKPGEYRIMCPTSKQYGYQPSQCTFYWTHFSYHDFNNDPAHYDSSEVSLPLNADDTHVVIPTQAAIPQIDRLIVLFKQLQNCNRKYRNHNLDNHTLTAILCELYRSNNSSTQTSSTIFPGGSGKISASARLQNILVTTKNISPHFSRNLREYL